MAVKPKDNHSQDIELGSGLDYARPHKIDLKSVEYLPGELLRAVEDRLIKEVLHLTKGNKTRAAKILGISVRTLRYKTSAKEDR